MSTRSKAIDPVLVEESVRTVKESKFTKLTDIVKRNYSLGKRKNKTKKEICADIIFELDNQDKEVVTKDEIFQVIAFFFT